MDFGPVVPESCQGLIRFGNGCLYPPLEACFPGLWSSSDSLVEKDKERSQICLSNFFFSFLFGATKKGSASKIAFSADARFQSGSHVIAQEAFKAYFAEQESQ